MRGSVGNRWCNGGDSGARSSSIQTTRASHKPERQGGREGSGWWWWWCGGGFMCYERAGSRCDSRAPTHLTHNSARQQEAAVWSTNGASLLLFTVTESTSKMSETQTHELLLLVLLVETVTVTTADQSTLYWLLLGSSPTQPGKKNISARSTKKVMSVCLCQMRMFLLKLALRNTGRMKEILHFQTIFTVFLCPLELIELQAIFVICIIVWIFENTHSHTNPFNFKL